MIAADEAANAAQPAAVRRPARAAAAAIALLVPVGAFAVYLVLGSPELVLRGPGPQTAAGDRSIESLVSELGRRLEARPNDARGWALYARSLAGLGRFAEALPAFERARALEPNDADLASRHAEAQIFAAGGNVTPAARQTLDAVRALDPREPRMRFYSALAAFQDGRPREALESWLALEATSPAEAPWREMLGQRIDGAARAAGVDAERLAAMRREAAARAPAPPPAATAPSPALPGPTAEQMEAAQQMSPEDRMAMIRSMVGRLAERLKQNPNDADGWRRLARAYEVLNEPEKAKEAQAKAAALQGKVEGAPAPAAPPPGPTPEQMRAAQEMSPEARTQMVRGMVEGLAARLEQQPGDFDGWMRLGRSWGVLGDAAKARDAYAKAAALRPNDAEALGRWMETMADAAPKDAPMPAEIGRIAERILAIDPDRPSALWYAGSAKAAAGDTAAARRHWERLLTRLDPSSPQHAELRKHLEALGRRAP